MLNLAFSSIRRGRRERRDFPRGTFLFATLSFPTRNVQRPIPISLSTMKVICGLGSGKNRRSCSQYGKKAYGTNERLLSKSRFLPLASFYLFFFA